MIAPAVFVRSRRFLRRLNADVRRLSAVSTIDRGAYVLMRARHLGAALLALSVAAPAVAQERDRDREQAVREAERRLEEARSALDAALSQLRGQEEEARRSMERALRQLRQAERDLDRWRLRGEIRDIVVMPGGDDKRAFVRVMSQDRARMGVILDNEASAASDSLGARLQAVTPGGPADEAGLRAGDIVTHVNEQAIGSTERRGERPGRKLARLVREREEGDSLRIRYRRDGQTHQATVVLRQLGPSAYGFAWEGDSTNVWSFDADRWSVDVGELPLRPRIDIEPLRIRMPLRWLDMELVTLDEELGEYFGTTEGVLVVRGPKEPSLNLRSGDVILSIDGRVPNSPSHALRIMRSYEPGESLRIEIMRNKRKTTVTATAPARE